MLVQGGLNGQGKLTLLMDSGFSVRDHKKAEDIAANRMQLLAPRFRAGNFTPSRGARTQCRPNYSDPWVGRSPLVKTALKNRFTW